MSVSNEVTFVLPDGCCDVIVKARRGTEEKVFLTGWEISPRRVELSAGTSLTGYRLKPGVTIAPDVIAERHPDSAQSGNTQFEALIAESCREDTEITGIITELAAPGITLAQAARQAGTTTRTLQRRFQDQSLPTPGFWRLLARARRAVAALPYCVPLAEIALAYGYSDQAHMSREFVRWFGISPAHLRQKAAMIDEICQPGLGNWIDDHPLAL